MADPTAVVHDGRIYVYGTNDHQQYDVVGRNGKNTYQHIHSLTMVSSDDMVNWTYASASKKRAFFRFSFLAFSSILAETSMPVTENPCPLKYASMGKP